MKHPILCAAIAALLWLPVSADIGGHDLLSIDNTDSYVASLLASPETKGKAIRNIRQLETARSRVWNEWRQRLLASIDTTKLPDVNHPLGSDTTAVWHIPAYLEPDARMLLRYGMKGNPGSGKLPLFIYLHGSGPRDQEWATGLALARRFADAPSLYIIPRIANTGEWYRWYQRGKQQAIESWLRLAMARGIDPARIYIFGISEGGYGSQRLASFYADYLAGAGPMAGGEPLRNAPPENLRNTAFSFLTGAADNGFYRNRLTAITRNALDSLQALSPSDYTHRIELIEGKGHAIDYSSTTPWLAAHTRKAMPRRVSWENFDMDGRKRNAFHNLAVSEPAALDNDSTPLRTRYELAIDSAANAIDLKVDRVHYTVTETDPNWGIQLTFAKSYEPAREGKVRIYLSPELLDLSKPVALRVNGRELGKRKVRMNEATLAESAQLFGDPLRLFPASITIDLANLR